VTRLIVLIFGEPTATGTPCRNRVAPGQAACYRHHGESPGQLAYCAETGELLVKRDRPWPAPWRATISNAATSTNTNPAT